MAEEHPTTTIKHGPRWKDLTGKRFGRLRVMEPWLEQSGPLFLWLCRCVCGELAVCTSGNLNSGNSTSCGCKAKERLSAMRSRHRMSGSPEYICWARMKARCHNQKSTNYKYYGARGIVMCAKWRDSFEAFYEDMGPKPSALHSLDRIDNNGNYGPSNCRWATKVTQANNTRGNHHLSYAGKTLTVTQWARELGIWPSTIRCRLEANLPMHLVLSPTKIGRRLPEARGILNRMPIKRKMFRQRYPELPLEEL